jgi:chromate reductase, NAD(P)H dehydrogenase (quinone)
MSVRNIAVLVGSLRSGALSRKVADALPELAPEGLKLDIVEIGDLPLYNQDLETDTPPQAWTRFRDQLRGADGVIFVTPEFNRGLPAALKNAIDVGSRPYGASVFDGKPAAVISQSPGALGGFGANHQLRQSLVFLDMPVLQQPEAYLVRSHEAFDDEGRIVSEPVRELLANLLRAYARLVHARAPLRAAA